MDQQAARIRQIALLGFWRNPGRFGSDVVLWLPLWLLPNLTDEQGADIRIVSPHNTKALRNDASILAR